MILIRTLLACAVLFVAANQAGALTIYSQSQAGSVGGTAVLTFTGALPAASDATLSLFADPCGELFNNGKRLEQLTVDGMTYQTPGQTAGRILPVNFLDTSGGTPAPVTIPLADLSGFVADGQVEVSVTRPGFLSGGVFHIVLEYTAVPEPSALAMGVVASFALLGRRRRNAA